MNKLVKRGLSAYKIVLGNKLATSLMMLFGGVMLSIGAFSGNGNDTKSLPSMILAAGAILTFWGFYKIGYLKAILEKLNRREREEGFRGFIMQIGETFLYLVIAVVGLFLLINPTFTNRALNIMTGCFTIFAGVTGVINAVKNRAKFKTFGWKFMASLTLIELALGCLFIFTSDTINIVALGVMGVITTIAGIIEVISALRKDSLAKTVEDGKEIIKVLKDEKVEDEATDDAAKGDKSYSNE